MVFRFPTRPVRELTMVYLNQAEERGRFGRYLPVAEVVITPSDQTNSGSESGTVCFLLSSGAGTVSMYYTSAVNTSASTAVVLVIRINPRRLAFFSQI
jgi:hypothetical protein